MLRVHKCVCSGTRIGHIFQPWFQTGYREGTLAGELSLIQSGFDHAFTSIGAPIGRELGILRGTASAMLALLLPSAKKHKELFTEAQEVETKLANVSFPDFVLLQPADWRGGEFGVIKVFDERSVTVDTAPLRTLKKTLEELGLRFALQMN